MIKKSSKIFVNRSRSDERDQKKLVSVNMVLNSKCVSFLLRIVFEEHRNNMSSVLRSIRDFDKSTLSRVEKKNEFKITFNWINDHVAENITSEDLMTLHRNSKAVLYVNIASIVKYLSRRHGIMTFMSFFKEHRDLENITSGSNGVAFLHLEFPERIVVYFKSGKTYTIDIPYSVPVQTHEIARIFEKHEEVVREFECPVCMNEHFKTQDEIVYCFKCFNYLDIKCMRKVHFVCPFCRYDGMDKIHEVVSIAKFDKRKQMMKIMNIVLKLYTMFMDCKDINKFKPVCVNYILGSDDFYHVLKKF